MRYVLIMRDDESDRTGPKELSADPVHEAWLASVRERGLLVTGEHLRPIADATTVRARDGRVVVTDGPFAETKDVVGGFAVVECADLEDAIEVAAGHPYARHGCVEIRPVWSG